jgi:nucleoside-diphosphate-sugar epimerase
MPRIHQGAVAQKEENHTSKAKADVMVRAASNANLSHENGLRTRCIRIPGFYGEGDKHMIISGLQLARWGLAVCSS